MNWIDINKQKPSGNKKVLTFSPDLEEAQYRLLNPGNFKTFPDQVKYWCEIIPPNFAQQTKVQICPICDGDGEKYNKYFGVFQKCGNCNGTGKL